MQAIYNFAPCLQGICSCIEFRDKLCTCKLEAGKYGESVLQSTTSNFDLGLSGLAPLLHIWKLFFTNLWGVVYAYKFIFELVIFCWLHKMSRLHVVLFCNLIGTARPRWQKLTTFPVDVTRFSPPPIFEEKAWGRGYPLLSLSFICVSSSPPHVLSQSGSLVP